MKFRPKLDTLERREVPSVTTTDDTTTTPPPYMPPADTGTPPVDGAGPQLDTPAPPKLLDPVAPGDKPKAEEPANPLANNNDYLQIQIRLFVLEKMVELYTENIDNGKVLALIQSKAVDAAKQVVKEKEAAVAEALAEWRKNPTAFNARYLNAMESELKGATDSLNKQNELLSNINNRIDAMKECIKIIQSEITALHAHVGKMLDALQKGQPMPELPALKSLNLPTDLIEGLDGWYEPLKAQAPK